MTSNNHPEWAKENSLTSPEDRDRSVRWRPEQGPPLTDQQTASAMAELNNTAFTEKFPRVDRTYADPPVNLQTYGLFSFVPAKGATPNQNGVFGFAKLRGNFATEAEADQRAEFIIRNADSYHQIYHTYVGRPFPVTVSSKFSAETNEIDIRKQTTESMSTSVKEKKMEEKKAIDDMKQREEQLLAESKRDPSDVDPFDTYITLKVKKAQLSWTYLEHQKKMAEVRTILRQTKKTLDEMDTEFPDYQGQYFQKYMDARRSAGFDDSKTNIQDNFMKFLVEDAVLTGVYDEEEEVGEQKQE
jgi:Family of unknown function (DUF5832)